ncbi:GntR family transcriptional regulator [Streptomyces beijiangensis]|uniref:GntR family transcriptional regulator n=1 Tax=Streptomyces beijiangensis TaxID=163361 RepID=A0A939F9N8_9ACTN|nr:GntR family transcriptional regulator [Streptomyces beijiangensis]MBO0515196.1 GntR family transcriptional regulator [Streptomyces beijiangensis]
MASTAQRTADLLRRRITQGALAPGTRLSEEALGEAMGVSRNTLREAFRLLAHDRLVAHEPNRGVFVRRLEVADITDIYAVRTTLESAGVRASATAPAGQLRAVAEAVEAGEAAADAADWGQVGTADLRFHQALGALSCSSRIDTYLAGLLAEQRLAFATMPSQRLFHEPFLRRNRTIADLLTAGRTTAAEDALHRYLEDACRTVLDALQLQLQLQEGP